MLIGWLLFLHVLSAITFFLAHGAAAAAVFKLRSESDFARIRAILDLSGSTFPVYVSSFFILCITGLVLPFTFHVWNKGWVWLSIILILFVAVWMGVVNEKQFKELRRLVGLPYMKGSKDFPAESPASAEEVAVHLKKLNPHLWATIGYGIPVIVLWLMFFKPF